VEQQKLYLDRWNNYLDNWGWRPNRPFLQGLPGLDFLSPNLDAFMDGVKIECTDTIRTHVAQQRESLEAQEKELHAKNHTKPKQSSDEGMSSSQIATVAKVVMATLKAERAAEEAAKGKAAE
jgi:hypothetical protein